MATVRQWTCWWFEFADDGNPRSANASKRGWGAGVSERRPRIRSSSSARAPAPGTERAFGGDTADSSVSAGSTAHAPAGKTARAALPPGRVEPALSAFEFFHQRLNDLQVSREHRKQNANDVKPHDDLRSTQPFFSK
jgi:hypothetical protein